MERPGVARGPDGAAVGIVPDGTAAGIVGGAGVARVGVGPPRDLARPLSRARFIRRGATAAMTTTAWLSRRRSSTAGAIAPSGPIRAATRQRRGPIARLTVRVPARV